MLRPLGQMCRTTTLPLNRQMVCLKPDRMRSKSMLCRPSATLSPQLRSKHGRRPHAARAPRTCLALSPQLWAHMAYVPRKSESTARSRSLRVRMWLLSLAARSAAWRFSVSAMLAKGVTWKSGHGCAQELIGNTCQRSATTANVHNFGGSRPCMQWGD